MKPSSCDDRLRGGPLHAAIIMDGNGRWAERRGLVRSAGHRAGAEAVRRAVTAAAARGIGTLTLYAFSADNWRRPAAEVRHLMHLFRAHLRSEASRCRREGVRVSVIGRRDRLTPGLLAAIESIEARTREGTGLHLLLAIDYSGRDAILEAARLHRSVDETPPAPGSPGVSRSPAPTLSREAFARLMAEALHAPTPLPGVDLLIRTGGEQRLSDFMLWECAYAEIVFTPCLWPDFGEAELDRALAEFRRRDRRFGGVHAHVEGDAPQEGRPVPLSPSTPSPRHFARTVRERKARARG